MGKSVVYLGMMRLVKKDEKELVKVDEKELAKVDKTELKAAHASSTWCPLGLHSLLYVAAKAGVE